MMPQIDAGERLAAITNSAIAAGSMDKNDSGKIVRRLEEVADGVKRRTERANPAILAAMGIAVSGPQEPAEGGLSDV